MSALSRCDGASGPLSASNALLTEPAASSADETATHRQKLRASGLIRSAPAARQHCQALTRPSTGSGTQPASGASHQRRKAPASQPASTSTAPAPTSRDTVSRKGRTVSSPPTFPSPARRSIRRVIGRRPGDLRR
ncbi:hypothetical protein GCM10007977_066810 [Dactylosporangium sucinum]|uniref:Uncharacterized protein n=1 Tax=Dactylosporangium sucinum TaxID=1424081 RepID=A0A917U533_9ACTN|nr:hypothetical protein GCM10007977_066810 [Dactylosporangium sucinum]